MDAAATTDSTPPVQLCRAIRDELSAQFAERETVIEGALCALVEVHTKLRNILGRVDTILEGARESGRTVERAESIRAEIASIRREILTHE